MDIRPPYRSPPHLFAPPSPPRPRAPPPRSRTPPRAAPRREPGGSSYNARVYVRRLTLTNFRCYRRLDLTLPCETIVVCGRNAQGKTSLVEAVYCLATTRSPTASADREVVHWQAAEDGIPFSRVHGEVARADGAVTLDIVTALQSTDAEEPRYGKRVQVNGVPRRALDVLGHLNVVLFTPQDIEVVAGAPAERRRYLDVLLCQIDRAYCRALSTYNQVLAQRNHLLRKLRDRSGKPDELAFWDERLAHVGGQLIERRLATVVALDALAAPLHGDLVDAADPHGPLEVRYLPGLRPARRTAWQPALAGLAETPAPYADLPPDADGLAARLHDALGAQRADDIARAATQAGPHRDDLAFRLGGIDMRTYGSRGQQRTVILALKLAEAQRMWSETGERPVLLLDDVLSELDAVRRRHLLARIEPRQQTIITTTQVDALPDPLPPDTLVLEVEAAAVVAARRAGRAVTPPVREREQG